MKVSATKTKMKKIGLKKSIKNKSVFKSSKMKKIKKSKETFKENGNTHKLVSKTKSGLQNNGKRESHITQTKQKTSLDDTESELEEQLDESEDEPNTHNHLFQNQSENESDNDVAENYDDEVEAHKKSLAKLKEVDPEFYKFLEENDQKLLKFNVSDDEKDEDDDNVTDDVHKPDEDDLQVASDESDFEHEDDVSDGKKGKVTLKMLKKWQAKLQTDKSNKTIGCVIKAFHAAMLRVSAQNDESPEYKVEGSSVFNAVIQLCVLELGPAIRRFLGISRSKQPPHKCKRFVKIKSLLKSYFADLLKLLGGVTSSNILTVLLKHMHYMSSMMVSFPNLAKPTIKRLVNLWGTGDETVRVVAFLCIVRIVGNRQTGLLDTTLKSMHMTYVKNSKFVSVSALPAINFMRRSLVEMFALDLNVAYQHVFLYVRQLAIHLRNAITMHKKEHIQAVYNWQFVNSLKLWGNLLEVTTYNDRSQLQPLLYPLVQVCLGTIKLIPTAQYYPLRFHIVQILMDISRETGVFIPILPFLTEILQSYNFNKKHTKVSMKPLQFTCILRLSKSQLQENGFKDALVESVYAQLLEYLSNQSNSIAFPDLSLLCVIQLKKFLKTCRVTNYCKKMRQILEKIKQNGEFIKRERRNVTFALTDLKQIEGWQTTIKNKGTPLSIYYDNWNKIRTVKRNKQATENDKIGDYNLPALKKTKKEKKESDKNDSKEPPNPFPSDSESDIEFNFGGNSDEDDEDEDKEKAKDKRKAKDREHKKTRGSRGGKKLKNKEIRTNNEIEDSNFAATDDVEDVIEDIKLSEW